MQVLSRVFFISLYENQLGKMFNRLANKSTKTCMLSFNRLLPPLPNFTGFVEVTIESARGRKKIAR